MITNLTKPLPTGKGYIVCFFFKPLSYIFLKAHCKTGKVSLVHPAPFCIPTILCLELHIVGQNATMLFQRFYSYW